MEVNNELLLWERCPEECLLLGGYPFLGGSFVSGSTVVVTQLLIQFVWVSLEGSKFKNAGVFQCPPSFLLYETLLLATSSIPGPSSLVRALQLSADV